MTTQQIITVEERKKALLDTLIPELKAYVKLFNAKEETLKFLSELLQGVDSFFHGDIKDFVQNQFIPDFLEQMICLKSQVQICAIFLTIKNRFDISGKKVAICYNDSKTKILWFDCRTQNYSLYLESINRHAKENTYFISGYFFPDKI